MYHCLFMAEFKSFPAFVTVTGAYSKYHCAHASLDMRKQFCIILPFTQWQCSKKKRCTDIDGPTLMGATTMFPVPCNKFQHLLPLRSLRMKGRAFLFSSKGLSFWHSVLSPPLSHLAVVLLMVLKVEEHEVSRDSAIHPLPSVLVWKDLICTCMGC